MGIVVLGSSNTDMIVRVPRIPQPGETVLGGEFATAAGGKGANQAVAAARAGARVELIARLGRDALGDDALAGFEREGIDVRHVGRDATTPSGVALIFVEDSGENAIAVASGANAGLLVDAVEAARGVIAAADVLLMQLETPLAAIEAAAAIAHEAGKRVILNPAPARELPDALLERVSILTPNQAEAEQLTGLSVREARDAEAAGRTLLERGVESVVLTLGAAGCRIVTPEGVQSVEGHPVSAVDTTGAGDVFNGAMTARLAEGASLSEAARFANAAAALSVTRHGAQPSAPQRAEIEALLAR